MKAHYESIGRMKLPFSNIYTMEIGKCHTLGFLDFGGEGHCHCVMRGTLPTLLGPHICIRKWDHNCTYFTACHEEEMRSSPVSAQEYTGVLI